MHRDQKVGLAFGILLIGAVAAFFFRNETQPEEAAPELENSADIDDEIRALPRHPEVELDPNIQTVDEGSRDGSFDSLFPPLDATGSAPEPFHPLTAQPSDGVVPPPISIDSHPGINESRTLDHDSTATATDPSSVRYYTVKAGDTLTGLAIRFLGRSSRYHEIFEANRDVLASPDALKPNVRIRIPAKDRSAARPVEAVTPRTTQTPPTTPSREFVPDPMDRNDWRTSAAPVSRSTSNNGAGARHELISREDAMSRAAPPEDFRRRPTVDETEAIPFASSTPSSGVELEGIFSDSADAIEDIAAPSSSRPRTQPSGSQARFVAYGRSPLGFEGPFAESDELARKTAAPPPPKRVPQKPVVELRDLDDLQPITIPDSTVRPDPVGSRPSSAAPTESRQLPSVRKYQVRRGDSLEGIAIRYYGTRKAIPQILRANRDRLSNPDRLRAGMTIILP